MSTTQYTARRWPIQPGPQGDLRRRPHHPSPNGKPPRQFFAITVNFGTAPRRPAHHGAAAGEAQDGGSEPPGEAAAPLGAGCGALPPGVAATYAGGVDGSSCARAPPFRRRWRRPAGCHVGGVTGSDSAATEPDGRLGWAAITERSYGLIAEAPAADGALRLGGRSAWSRVESNGGHPGEAGAAPQVTSRSARGATAVPRFFPGAARSSAGEMEAPATAGEGSTRFGYAARQPHTLTASVATSTARGVHPLPRRSALTTATPAPGDRRRREGCCRRWEAGCRARPHRRRQARLRYRAGSADLGWRIAVRRGGARPGELGDGAKMFMEPAPAPPRGRKRIPATAGGPFPSPGCAGDLGQPRHAARSWTVTGLRPRRSRRSADVRGAGAGGRLGGADPSLVGP